MQYTATVTQYKNAKACKDITKVQYAVRNDSDAVCGAGMRYAVSGDVRAVRNLHCITRFGVMVTRYAARVTRFGVLMMRYAARLERCVTFRATVPLCSQSPEDRKCD